MPLASDERISEQIRREDYQRELDNLRQIYDLDTPAPGCTCRICERMRNYMELLDEPGSAPAQHQAAPAPAPAPPPQPVLDIELARGDSLRLSWQGVVLACVNVRGASYNMQQKAQRLLRDYSIPPDSTPENNKARQKAANTIVHTIRRDMGDSA